MTRRRILLQWIRIALGLLVFAFGVHLTIRANIGLAPWDCLGMGLSYLIRFEPRSLRHRGAAEMTRLLLHPEEPGPG